MAPLLHFVPFAIVAGAAIWAAVAPGWRRPRESERDVAAVMAAHRVTDGPVPSNAGLRRLLAAVRGAAPTS